MGARLTSITGIVDYRAGRYTIRPLSPPTVTWVPPDRTEVALPTLHVAPMNAAGCEAIAVASYNAYKMTDEHGAHGMAIHVVKYLHNPAIVFLQEVAPAAKPQNNFGNIATTLDRLCQDIFKISQVLYRWAIVDDIDPSHEASETYEGLTPRNAYIYNPKTVKLVEPTRGRATPMKPTWPEKVKGRDEYALTNNPGYVEPHQVSPIFRKPLAALFETVSTKTRLWVINVHLQSKRGTGSLYSDLRPPRDPRLRLRVQQMNLVAGFVKEIQKKAGAEANIILAGDFNEWKGAQSVFDPLNGLLLDAAVVTGMDPTEQYTLLHESSALGLDHMFISPSLASPSAGFEFEVLHVNTWSTLLAGRVSDHDPIMGRYQTCRQPGVVTNKQPPGVQPPPDVPMSRDTEVEGVSKIQVDSPSLSKQQVENQWQVMGPRRRRPPKKGRY
ncbi:hypothetical protein FRB96_009352 [Tulasnella sp. 330]|nr:hypothetical protein FRB96_009352 [Tulasnella sp. 330]